MAEYNIIMEATLFEPTETKNENLLCQNITQIGTWNKNTSSIDAETVTLEAGKEYSIQLWASNFETRRGKKKFNLRISEVINDGSVGNPFQPAIKKISSPFN
jgi:hypothetical protein